MKQNALHNNGVTVIKNEQEPIKRITKLIAVYLFCAPLDFLQIIPGVSLSRFLIFLPLAGCIFYMNKAKVIFDKFFLAIGLYLLMVTFTLTYSINYSSTIQRVITVILNITVIFILSLLPYNKRELTVIKKAIAYSGWFTVALMLLYSNTSIMGGRLTVIVHGNYQDPNYLCGFLIYSVVYYWEKYLKHKKFFSLVVVGVFLTFVLLTGSRGGLIAVGGALLFYLAAWIKNTKFKFSSIIKVILLIGFIVLLFNFAVSNLLPESISSRLNINFTLNDRGANRFDIWEKVLNNYQSSPSMNKLFGWGAGTIRNFLYNDVGHNIWIESSMEIGLVGVAILLFLYMSYFIKSCKMHEFVVAASFFGYLIMTMSLSLYSYKPIWNILLIIMLLKNYEYQIKHDIKSSRNE